MSKKVKIGLMLTAIILLIVLLSLGAILWSMAKNGDIVIFGGTEVDYKMISNQYSDYSSKIISSYQEYQEFAEYIESQRRYYLEYDINLSKYNEEYFKTNSLAIINITTGTGMNKFKGIKFLTKDDALIYKANIEYTKSDVITLDMNGKLFLVEIDKSITNLKDYTK